MARFRSDAPARRGRMRRSSDPGPCARYRSGHRHESGRALDSGWPRAARIDPRRPTDAGNSHRLHSSKGKNVLCIYCAIGQRSSSVAKVIADLKRHDALERVIVVVAAGDTAAGLQFSAPYAAMSMGEYFMGGAAMSWWLTISASQYRAYRDARCLGGRRDGRAFLATFSMSTRACWSISAPSARSWAVDR